MKKPDEAHMWTDAELEKLERRIAAEYKKAADELTDKITAYFESFKKRDEKQKKLIGEIVGGREYTEQDYQQWRLAQIGRGKRFEALRDRVAERMTHANEVAAAYMNDATPEIYSLNRNYAAYTIEKDVGGNVGFDLWDEQTVKRLLVEEPDLMPYYPPKRAVKRGIDLAWGKQQITKQVVSGILQGESIKHLADRLQTNIPNMNRGSAIRAARTAVTGAQNAGRIDSYSRAEEMGIKLKKRWVSTLDGRTRHAHQLLDGQTQDNEKPFHSILGDIMFPGDPNAVPANVYNCRCTLIAEVDGVDMSDARRRAVDLETGEKMLVENMTYEEWAGWKSKNELSPLAKEIEEEIKAKHIEYREVKKLHEKQTEKQIVDKLSGGDLTSGSCSSLAFAYAGNKCGLDVTDYRGGESTAVFSRNSVIKKIAELPGVESAKFKGKKEIDAAKKALSSVKGGKEYYLSAGKHAAIVRRTDDNMLQYLEMQSASHSGWTQFTTETLPKRFGCRKTVEKSYGFVFEKEALLIDVDSFHGSSDFQRLLGYINTAADDQKKGVKGYAK